MLIVDSYFLIRSVIVANYSIALKPQDTKCHDFQGMCSLTLSLGKCVNFIDETKNSIPPCTAQSQPPSNPGENPSEG